MCWQIDTDSGTLIPEASGSLQYRLNKDAIGKFVSFTCTPIRDDLIVGEPKTCMGQERVRPGTGIYLTFKFLCTSYCISVPALTDKNTRLTRKTISWEKPKN